MFDIAISVWACVRSGTRADIALMIEPRTSDEAVAFTPGGGRLGTLAGGAFDGFLADEAARQRSLGRVLEHDVTLPESALCGLPPGTPARFLLIPSPLIPEDAWPDLVARTTVALRFARTGDELHAADRVDVDALPEGVELAERATSVTVLDDAVIVVLVPTPRLVVAGRGPTAEALGTQGGVLGWRVHLEASPQAVSGLAAGLTDDDAIVVIGHDVEASSQCLLSALESSAGYVGALGSARMQQARADWLAYRDVTDLSRVHGPAGLDIGAATPQEIAVSIAAEIIATRRPD